MLPLTGAFLLYWSPRPGAHRRAFFHAEGERPHPQCFLTRGSRRSGSFSADLPVSCSKNSPAAFLASSSHRSASNKGSPTATSSGNVKSKRLTRRRSGEVSNRYRCLGGVLHVASMRSSQIHSKSKPPTLRFIGLAPAFCLGGGITVDRRVASRRSASFHFILPNFNTGPASAAVNRPTKYHWSHTPSQGTDSVGTNPRAPAPQHLGSALIERGITAVLAALWTIGTPAITGSVSV